MRRKYRNILAGALMLMLISIFLTGMVSAQNNDKVSSNEISSNDAHILNGMEFRGKLGMFGEKEGRDEDIFFENGTFHSLLCDACGFTPSQYTIGKNSEGKIIFKTEAVNKDGDKIVWNGVIKLDETGITRRDKIDAYATFVPSGKESVLYWMKGEASEQSMKYSGKNVEDRIETVSMKTDQ